MTLNVFIILFWNVYTITPFITFFRMWCPRLFNRHHFMLRPRLKCLGHNLAYLLNMSPMGTSFSIAFQMQLGLPHLSITRFPCYACTLPINPLGIHLLQCPHDNDHIGRHDTWCLCIYHQGSQFACDFGTIACVFLLHITNIQMICWHCPLQRWGAHLVNIVIVIPLMQYFFVLNTFLHMVSHSCISFAPSNFYTWFCNFRGNPKCKDKTTKIHIQETISTPLSGKCLASDYE